jgi:hypothetical protein
VTSVCATEAESERLIKLANLVTWGRSGAERDFKGEVLVAQFASRAPHIIGRPQPRNDQPECARDALYAHAHLPAILTGAYAIFRAEIKIGDEVGI